LLVYRLGKLPWTGIAKVAPLEQALCGLADITPQVFGSLYDWSELRVREEATYKAFVAEMKLHGMGVDDISTSFFSPYASFSGFGNNAGRRFGRKERPLGLHRFGAVLVENASAGPFIDFYHRQLSEFGRLAFIAAPEGSDKERGADSADVDLSLFRHLPRDHAGSDKMHEGVLQNARNALVSAVERLERGDSLDLRLRYQDVVRPPISLGLTHRGEFGSPSSAMEEEVYLLRAKFLRMLAWPQTYSKLVFCMEDINRGLSEGVGKLNFLKVFSDAIRECVVALETRYPVLLSNPLSTEKGLI
jgi:hypothetical protein